MDQEQQAVVPTAAAARGGGAGGGGVRVEARANKPKTKLHVSQ